MHQRFGKHAGLLSGAIGLVVSAMAHQALGQTQLLLNTGFENPPDTTGANNDLTATGWTYYGGAARASFQNHTTGGEWSTWLQPYNAPGGVYQVYAGPVTAGSNYTLNAYWYFEAGFPGTGTIADYQIDFLNAAGVGVGPDNGYGAGVYQTNIQPASITTTGAWVLNAGGSPLVATAPAGATQIQVEFDLQNFVTETHMSESAFVDDVTLMGLGTSPVPQWANAGSGSYSVGANWSTGNAPSGVGSDAEFLGSIKANSNVYVDTPITAGTVHFNNAFSYVLDGAAGIGSLGQPATAGLTLQASTGNAAVNVDQGTQEINLPTNVASNTVFDVASGATLIIGNPIWINPGLSLTQTGTGTVTYNSIITVNSGSSITFGNSTHANELSVAATGTATVGGTKSVVEVDNLSNAGTLNLQNNELLINYGSGADPIASIAAEIKSGYASGAWTGKGIDSSVAAANSGSFGIGYADAADAGNPAGLAPGTIEVVYTLLGDANLDGKVNSIDFAILASDFNKGVTGSSGWVQGDFNYDGSVNSIDFADLASNFNKGTSIAVAGNSDFAALDAFAAANGLLADVPEPATLSVLAIGAAGLLGRRRRS